MSSDSSPSYGHGENTSQEPNAGDQDRRTSAGAGTTSNKTNRQRFKPQLSCTLCRNRKLKCDRQLPCGNCVKRGVTSSCTFVHGAPNQRASSTGVQKSTSNPRDVQTQIQHLEELVLSMMNRANKPAPAHESSAGSAQLTPESGQSNISMSASQSPNPQPLVARILDADMGDSADTFGRISIEDHQMNYVGQSHWTAILDNIAGLKDTLDMNKRTSPEPILSAPDSNGPDLLLSSIPRITRSEILAALPPRAFCKALVDSYLGIPDMGSTIVHRPTFTKEFNKFWSDPTSTPISWVGLLFSILALATHCETVSGEDSTRLFEGHILLDPVEGIELYRHKTIQCLLLSNYTEPDQYTIPCLIVYYVIEHFRSEDAQFGTWMLYGMIVRAAMRLGYHRDPSHTPKISILQGEMQRRLWDTIIFFDLQTSLQVGLPRMIREGMYDTRMPRNLFDDDLDENATVLPEPRPPHDVTPIGYSSWKHSLALIFGRIIDQSNKTTSVPYDEVMVLDREIHMEQAKIPSSLRIRQPSDLREGSPQLRFRRFAIDLTYQKARCVLHRKYIFPSKHSGKYPYPYSVRACVDAGLRLLQCQYIMFNETLPGQDLHGQRWKASSLVNHDFLLAAMIVCVYAGNSLTIKFPEIEGDEYAGENGNGTPIDWSRESLISTLQSSYKIWEATSSSSKDAARAAKTVKKMLERVMQANTSASLAPGKPISNPNIGFKSLSGQQDQLDTSEIASQPTTNWQQNMQPYFQDGGSYFDTSAPSSEQAQDNSSFSVTNIPPMSDSPINFDWELWDTHFHPNTLADTPPELWDFGLDAVSNTPMQGQVQSGGTGFNTGAGAGFDMQWDQS